MLVDTTFHRLVESTEEPFPTVIIVVLVVIEEPVICRRLFVFAVSQKTRLSTPTDGTSHIVNSRYAAPFTDTAFDAL